MLAFSRQLIDGTHLASIHDTGIGIFPEGGLQHLGMLSVVGMGNEVDGLGGSIGNQHTILIYVAVCSQFVFQ